MVYYKSCAFFVLKVKSVCDLRVIIVINWGINLIFVILFLSKIHAKS